MKIHGLQGKDLAELKLILDAIEYARYNPCMRRINGGFVRLCLGGFDGTVLTINQFYGHWDGGDEDSLSCLILDQCKLPLTVLMDKALTVNQKIETMLGKWTFIAEETVERKITVDESGMITTKTVTTLVESSPKAACPDGGRTATAVAIR